MTTELAIRFPWGRYHATPWGRHLNEGAVDWPPSPWRLLRALYAVWRFRAPELGEELVHGLLGKLAVAPSYDLPPFTRGATRHFLPGVDHREGVSTDRSLAIDAFVAVDRAAEVRVRWDVELTDDERQALEVLAGRLTYLGRGESLCDVRVVEPDPAAGAGEYRPLPADVGDDAVDVLVPRSPLDIGALTVSTTDVRVRERRRLPTGAVVVSYRRPEPHAVVVGQRAAPSSDVTIVRWSLAGRALPSRHAAVAVATRLRQRVMQQFGDAGVPSALSGKGADGSRIDGLHRHAHWFAFGDPGERRLATVAVWMPMRIGSDAIATLARVRTLRAGGIPDFGPQRLGVEGWGEPAVVVPELAGPSVAWESYTPFAPAIHRHGRPRHDDRVFLRAAVERELRWRGVDAQIVDLEVVDRPWRAYRSHRPDKERLRDSRQTWGVRLVFDREVDGPLALGQLSHFGLGLLVPSRADGEHAGGRRS